MKIYKYDKGESIIEFALEKTLEELDTIIEAMEKEIQILLSIRYIDVWEPLQQLKARKELCLNEQKWLQSRIQKKQ